jgi:hypothetical protein
MSKPQLESQSVLMNVEAASVGSLPAKPPVDKTFRRYDQDQPMLLAPDLRDWLAADHPARWVMTWSSTGWTCPGSTPTTPRPGRAAL